MKRIYLFMIMIVSIIAIPIVLWFLKPSENLNIAIIDKTVSDDSYREHQGLVWSLNHLKYTKEAHIPFQQQMDYFGAVPNKRGDNIDERPLPTNYKSYDVIYMADTYGVYADELFDNHKQRLGARSEKVYGGLQQAEWDAIMERLTMNKKSLFIAEFNTFASPTEAIVRKNVLSYLEMDWTGWVGRYFDELDFRQNSEIPQWVVDKYGDRWSYEGGGFLLVNDFTYEVVVLEDDKHVKEQGIHLQFTKQGQQQFDLSTTPKYHYWFDLVTVHNKDNIMANYQWDLTLKGRTVLEEKGIPQTFAAIVKNERKQATSYYFAGDFNDVGSVPIFYKMKGLPSIYSVANKFADDAFYWSVYMPIMEKILADFQQQEQVKETKKSSLDHNARINGQAFEVLQDGKWQSIIFKCVNIGMGKPGYFPGEAAITEEEYYRWFTQIGEMNANTIRVYTLNPPGFYKALARYNREAKTPLYVLHGIWAEEEGLEKTLDAFNKETVGKFHHEMHLIVDAIHGNANIEAVAGHASGLYDADVSEYVIGWIIGIEWYPEMVLNTNNTYAQLGQYKGKYFETTNAAPFEYWLAEQMDYLLQYEKTNYNWMRPISFTNWPTTDMLAHPSEPNEKEDLVGINPNTIYPIGEAENTGYFASYHVYPYYPDFMNYDERYLAYVDHRGNTNSYAGYLAELRQAHRMPVLIAEFGIPASRGLTHKNPYGWNQGFVTEQQQGEILQHLYEDIMAEDYLGGFVFTWQDEWFKRTWNTMDYDNPERRPYWSNAQTNEQQFGLLSFDRHKIQIDGNIEEWQAPALYKSKTTSQPSMKLDTDERYLYIQLKGQAFKQSTVQIVLDTIQGQGKQTKSDINNVQFSNDIDFVVELNRHKPSRIVIESIL